MKNLIIYLLFTLVGFLFLGSCKDSTGEQDQFSDPTKPVSFAEFHPSGGPARTKLFISGSNFGKDASKIEITIGGVKAPVIGTTGDKIYCVVPTRAFNGDIKVTISGEDGSVVTEHAFETVFDYEASETVGTVCGKVDPNNPTASMIDGSFEEAEFKAALWMLFDKNEYGEKILYLLEEDLAFRKIDLTNREVTTLFTNGQAGFKRMQSMTFDNTRDTIFFVDNNGLETKDLPVISYALRSEEFRRVYPYIYDRCGYSCVQHPTDGTLFYNTWRNSAVVKARGVYNEDTGEWEPKELYNIADNKNGRTFMVMHPEGKYVYFIGWNCVMKAMYNDETKELSKPTIHVGKQFTGGFADAPGTAARFAYPIQGIFLKNEQYVKEGREDVYDFYLVDCSSHTIRIVTPDAQVSTFAGHGSMSADGIGYGYIDGHPRKDARFDKPAAIAYDEETGTFYIAEINNRRIRSITVE